MRESYRHLETKDALCRREAKEEAGKGKRGGEGRGGGKGVKALFLTGRATFVRQAQLDAPQYPCLITSSHFHDIEFRFTLCVIYSSTL